MHTDPFRPVHKNAPHCRDLTVEKSLAPEGVLFRFFRRPDRRKPDENQNVRPARTRGIQGPQVSGCPVLGADHDQRSCLRDDRIVRQS